MTKEDLEKRQRRAETETLVISRTEEGFRVYSPTGQARPYFVSGSPEKPECTCPDFQNHRADPEWRCKHILAVLNQQEKNRQAPQATGRYEDEERKAIQEESPQPEKSEKKKRPRSNGNGSQMILKRSVSPDGRIDSLSVEFAVQIGSALPEEIRKRAEEVMNVQAEIAQGFLTANGKEPKAAPQQERKPVATDGSVPAEMLYVGGTSTRRGWSLFIAFRVNGKPTKLFGSKKELSDHVASAGYPSMADHIDQGMELKLPCRVIARPSSDGRYLNVERVLPAEPPKQPRRTW